MGKHQIKRRRLFICLSMVGLLALFSCPVKHVIKSHFGITARQAATEAIVNTDISSSRIAENSRHCDEATGVKIKYTVTHDAGSRILPPAEVLAGAYNGYRFLPEYRFISGFQNDYLPKIDAVPPFLRNKRLLI